MIQRRLCQSFPAIIGGSHSFEARTFVDFFSTSFFLQVFFSCLRFFSMKLFWAHLPVILVQTLLDETIVHRMGHSLAN
jgi:hypothetical protein